MAPRREGWATDPHNFEAVRIREEYGWPSDTPLIGQVALFYGKQSRSRWIPEFLYERGIKDHSDLVRAALFIRRKIPNAKMLFVGSAFGERGREHQDYIKELVSSLGLEDSVIFTGYRTVAIRTDCRAIVTVALPEFSFSSQK